MVRDALGNLTGEVTTTFYQSDVVTNIVEIKADGSSLLLLHRSGQVFALGTNSNFYMGTGRGTDELYGLSESAPYPVAGGETGTTYLGSALTLATGTEHYMAMVRNADGSHGVVAWGRNSEGQLGNNSTDPGRYPTYVLMTATQRLTNVVDIYAGGNSSAALVAHTPSGTVNDTRGFATSLIYMWGANQNRQLGNGGIDNALLPGRVLRGTSHNDASLNDNYQGYFNRVTDLSISDNYTLAVQNTGMVFGWNSSTVNAQPDQVGRRDVNELVVVTAELYENNTYVKSFAVNTQLSNVGTAEVDT